MNHVESPNPAGEKPVVARKKSGAKTNPAQEMARILSRDAIRGNMMAILLDDEDDIGGERPSLIDPSRLRRVPPLL